MKHNLERGRRSKSKKLAARSFAPGRSVYRSNRTVSRSLPPLLVFRVRFDRDHEAWRSCVCHSMTPGSKDRSATPPRTCTLQLCSSCKAAPLCSAPLRSFPSRDARGLDSRSQPPFRSLCCPLCSPRLASCLPRFVFVREASRSAGQWNERTTCLAMYARSLILI